MKVSDEQKKQLQPLRRECNTIQNEHMRIGHFYRGCLKLGYSADQAIELLNIYRHDELALISGDEQEELLQNFLNDDQFDVSRRERQRKDEDAFILDFCEETGIFGGLSNEEKVKQFRARHDAELIWKATIGERAAIAALYIDNGMYPFS